MKIKFLFFTVFSLFCAVPMMADDDVLITRDGTMISVKIEKISSSQVTFVDLKHKKLGKQNAPAEFVYMILKEKGSNIFFDEEGNQTTSPAVKYSKKDNVMFLNRGKMLVVYNVSVGKEDVTYQLKDKKKEPFIKIKKAEVFMMLYSDGTTILYNDSYQKKHNEQQTMEKANDYSKNISSVSVVQQSTTNPLTNTSSANSLVTTLSNQQENSIVSGQKLLASGTTNADFKPAADLSAADIEIAVNTKNPYTLYRKGSMAEYCFQYKGKKTQLEGGPTYVRQIVGDERIENGLLVAYIKQEFYNKKHEPSKGIPASFKGYFFPVEIDTAGTYHLTHNMLYDVLLINKRQGYGTIIPGDMKSGMLLNTSTLHDKVKHPLFGGNFNVETTYSNWKVEAEEKISTPAGTFDSVRLTGNIEQNKGKGSFSAKQKVTCWMARGIGIVQYETVYDSGKDNEPFIIYLNKLELK